MEMRLEFQNAVTMKMSMVHSIPQPSVQHFGMKWAKNNPDPSARCTYFGDCAGFTPAQCQSDGSVNLGSWAAANAFFLVNNYPAMIKPDGTIDYLLDPDDHAKKLDGTASNVDNHATDNAMSVFDCHIWIKMYEDTDYQYIEVANEQLDEGYVDFPYLRADGTRRDRLYYPMYEGTVVNGKLRSLASGTPTGNLDTAAMVSYANANDGMGSSSIWSIGDWSHHLWITLLSMLIGKTTCVEHALGEGNTNGSGMCTNGACIDKGAFWGKPRSSTDAENNQPVKLFYIENPYANAWKRTLGMLRTNKYSGLRAWAKMIPPYDASGLNYATVYEIVSENLPIGQKLLTQVTVTNYGFIPYALGDQSADSYFGANNYINDAYWGSPAALLCVGGSHTFGKSCGFWCFDFEDIPTNIYPNMIGSLYLYN